MSLITDESAAQIKQASERVLITVGAKLVTVMVNLGKQATVKSAQAGLSAADKAMKKIPGLPGQPERGKMSVKALQTKADGDVHPIKLEQDSLKALQKQLKFQGVDFGIEKGKDSNTYLHFKGKDKDAVMHAVEQAQAQLSKPQKRHDIKKAITSKVKAKSVAKTSVSKPVKAPVPRGPKL